MISQRAFATHLGVTPMVVSRGVKKGRLTKCVVRDDAGKPIGLSSLEEAAAEWTANSDYTDAPQRDPANAVKTKREGAADDAGSSVLRKNHFEAELKLVKLRKEAGELVDAAAVKKKQTEVYTHVRTRLLSIPTSLKQQAPDTPVATVALVEQLIHEALKELSS